MSGAGTKGAVMRGIAGALGLSAVLVGCVNLAGCVNLGGGKAPAMLIHLTPEASVAVGPAQSGAVTKASAWPLKIISSALSRYSIDAFP